MTQVATSGIQGSITFSPRVHGDRRGSFHEWLRADELAAEIGHPFEVAQANCSISARGALRGVHFADVPPGQAKYVTCMRGAVQDVIVDLRVGSPTFGQWESVLLDDQNCRAVYIAEGLGHAFQALTDEAVFVYLCSEPYRPGREHGIHPLDPELGIAWPAGIEPLLSPKDEAAPTLTEARRSGLLPDYQTCLDHYNKLAV